MAYVMQEEGTPQFWIERDFARYQLHHTGLRTRMKVLKPRAALLSDFEVLRVLKETEAGQKARSAKPATGAEAATGLEGTVVQRDTDDDWLSQVPENLRTVQYETIAALSQVTRPCAHQTAESIGAFLDALKLSGFFVTDTESRRGALGLNKSERLQIVNHAPQSVVELHTLVEELQDRFMPDQIDELLALIQTHLPVAVDGDVNVYAQDGAQGGYADIDNEPGPEFADGNQITELTGQVAAAAELGTQQEAGLAHVVGPNPETEVVDQDYEDEMDEDEFVNEGFAEGAVDVELDE